MKTRDVKIVVSEGAYLVMYTERKKGGRYYAAQFCKGVFDIFHVINWVENNKKLNLIKD